MSYAQMNAEDKEHSSRTKSTINEVSSQSGFHSNWMFTIFDSNHLVQLKIQSVSRYSVWVSTRSTYTSTTSGYIQLKEPCEAKVVSELLNGAVVQVAREQPSVHLRKMLEFARRYKVSVLSFGLPSLIAEQDLFKPEMMHNM